MSSVVKIQDNQELPASDLMRMQTLRRDQIDNLVGDAIDDTPKFAGFAVTVSGTTGLIIGAGRLYIARIGYSREADAGATFDLVSGTVQLPVSQGKIVSLVGWGSETDTDTQPREFETAVTNTSGSYTGEYTVESRDVATITTRRANLALLEGTESANPAPPAVGNGQVEIARILCSPTGVTSVSYVEANRLETVKDLDVRARSLEQFADAAGASINSIISDIAAIRSILAGLPSDVIVRMLVRDMARVKEIVGRPDDQTAYGALTFGTANEMDLTHAASLCSIDGTLTFPAAAIKEALYAFANPNEPLMQKRGTLTMPVHTEVLVIDTMLGLN